MSSYLNESGLVDGKIPAGKACPFAAECKLLNGRCPTTEKPNTVDYSCALARLHSMIRKTDNGLLKRVRDNLGRDE